MNFEQLLDGATKGPWFAVRNSHYYELNTEDRDTAQSIATFCASKCCFGEAVEKINTEYVARCNPAVMREVWAALHGARGFIEAGERTKGHSFVTGDKVRRALALLDGQTEK